MQKSNRIITKPEDLVTTYQETRAGFVALALEKNRIATPFVEQARSLKVAASKARKPEDLIKMANIRAALIKAAGISDKAETHMEDADKEAAIKNLIDKFLKPSGANFVEELVYRFLLTKGDALGGSMRNIGGAWGKKKFIGVLKAQLSIAGIPFKVIMNSSKEWTEIDEAIEDELIKGISWKRGTKGRTILFDFGVDVVKKNIDICVFSTGALKWGSNEFQNPRKYIALGELKGGIDPAGADEHWKTGHTALLRIKRAFESKALKPKTFFIAAAIEDAMANEIFGQIKSGMISNAANLNKSEQLNAVCDWLITL